MVAAMTESEVRESMDRVTHIARTISAMDRYFEYAIASHTGDATTLRLALGHLAECMSLLDTEMGNLYRQLGTARVRAEDGEQ